MTSPGTHVTSYGEFSPADANPAALTSLRVEFLAVDAIAEWTRCSVLANSIARYMAANFSDRTAAALILSTVLNELIENGAKFSARAEDSVAIAVLHFGDTLRIDVRNTTDEVRADSFRTWLQGRVAADAESLFLKKLSEPAGGIGRGSGIGLLILEKDYGARIAARIVPAEDGRMHVVEVQVTMNTEELEQQ